MPYDFTTLVSRRGTGSTKWDDMYRLNPNVPEEVFPLSVADMELKNPPQVAQGLSAYLNSSILGYTAPTERFYGAITRWQRRRNHWEVRPEWIVDYPGIVPALYLLASLLAGPGEGVILLMSGILLAIRPILPFPVQLCFAPLSPSFCLLRPAACPSV